ncbi:hypothetical protein Clacol_007546 [Clathrus columnatus]|uniref:GST N-terminal domain-containing protein n=1 Tax=Clathrus columnatus TaxID=1419009 RepID=A0AAV5AJI4_9AGAM|nr:hypothetical protein Clacol_007546 [Clathrus columnatus]
MSTFVEPKITLFDIPSTLKPKSWSGNVWKARFIFKPSSIEIIITNRIILIIERYILNYKQIPYKTVWVPSSEIEKTLLSLGGEGKATSKQIDDPSKPRYTLPAILDETGPEQVLVIDSIHIAEYLDEKYPETKIVMPKKDKALEFAVEALFQTTIAPHIMLPLLPYAQKVQDERCSEYFRKIQEKAFGKKLEEFSPEGPVREAQWDALKKALDTLAGILDKNGPNVDFVRGGVDPTFADFVIAARIRWMKTVAPEEWLNRGIEQWNNNRWGRLLKRFEEWEFPAE